MYTVEDLKRLNLFQLLSWKNRECNGNITLAMANHSEKKQEGNSSWGPCGLWAGTCFEKKKCLLPIFPISPKVFDPSTTN